MLGHLGMGDVCDNPLTHSMSRIMVVITSIYSFSLALCSSKPVMPALSNLKSAADVPRE